MSYNEKHSAYDPWVPPPHAPEPEWNPEWSNIPDPEAAQPPVSLSLWGWLILRLKWVALAGLLTLFLFMVVQP
jgi:hypothetical protein